jgi:N,N'-diacetyllegionaminate synthase
MKKVFIIAEAGVNHNGSLALAKKMVDAVADIGADAIKFQTFKAEAIASAAAPKAHYQRRTTDGREGQLEMLKRLELDEAAHVELAGYCRKKGIRFISSPFDMESVDLLKRLGLKVFKIPSGEIINLPYLRKIGSLGKKVILSTGMADMREIRNALKTLISSGTKRGDIVVLHCVTEYPAPVSSVNLKAMGSIRKAFGVEVGYSDHTTGIAMPIAAVALGARVIEKHFTLDKRMKGPDHKASLEPPEFKIMVDSIRDVEKAMGRGAKRPSYCEFKNRRAIRKSIVAARDIARGEIFDESNITTKRPGSGVSPARWDDVIGKAANKNYKKDEPLML